MVAKILNVFCILLCLVIYTTSNRRGNSLEEIFQWRVLEYSFPTAGDQANAVQQGNFVPRNGIPIDVAPHYGYNGAVRVFVTIPRFQTGVPYSLAIVTNQHGENGPVLQPYPSYEWHSSHGKDCSGITSAFRVAITECNQMWVIDSGSIGSTYHCPPQLLLFDLNTDQLLHRFAFPSNTFTQGASLFITPVAVVQDPPPSGQCQDTKVYVADVTNHGLVVYDYRQNVAWRVEHKFMYPDPDYGTHILAGESFSLMDGIFGLSSDRRNLFFHPLASVSEYTVPLQILNNQTLFANDATAGSEAFKLVGQRSSECAAEAMDSNGNLYCVTFNPVLLVSWNIHSKHFGKSLHAIPANPQLLEFVSGMKVVQNNVGQEELWMMSNRFQKISAGTQRENEINYQVIKRNLNDLQNKRHGSGNLDVDLHNQLVFN